jgi:hypothetical protein
LKSGFANGNLPTMTLTDPQQLAVIHATRPLAPTERAAFTNALAAMLAGRHDVGDGELGRMLKDLQRKHFKPPVTTAWT